jgi:hypothetical protein
MYTLLNWMSRLAFITGYPDGAFNGRRALTRYEFAVAFQRVMDHAGRRGELLPPASFRADSPWVHTGGLYETLPNALALLFRELSSELAMLGADVKKLSKSVSWARSDSGQALQPPRPFDPRRLDLLRPGPSWERARQGMRLLRDEIARPSAYVVDEDGPRGPGEALARIVETMAHLKTDPFTLLEAWWAEPPGRVRDCLTITLGLLGERSMQVELRRLTGDAALPVPLWELADRAEKQLGSTVR